LIRDIPETFGQNWSLVETMSLYINQIQTIPETFGQNWHNLSDLSFFKNKIQILPETFGQNWTKLRSFCIADNNLIHVPDTLGQTWTNLRQDINIWVHTSRPKPPIEIITGYWKQDDSCMFCSICHCGRDEEEDCKLDSKFGILSCSDKHGFHSSCIETWLIRQKTLQQRLQCPYCGQELEQMKVLSDLDHDSKRKNRVRIFYVYETT
jgi:hypothetical protein